MPELRTLVIQGGKIPDLEFVRGHATLRTIVVDGTAVVLNDDLSPLDDLPAAEVRYVRPRRSYNRRYDQLPVED